MVTLPARYGRWMPILVPLALLVLILHLHTGLGADNQQIVVDQTPPRKASSQSGIPDERRQRSKPKTTPDCPSLPGIEDVLVVLKTGITEAQEKVPIHLRTTLRCIPHKLIVSDFEEDIAGTRTRDVFRNASDKLRASEDFALYNRARAGGRSALLDKDNVKVANGPMGMADNPGWKLDKWKFLPMIQESRQYRPEARWYLFMEADTYPIWPNLLGWLQKFDSNRKLYLGNQMQIGDTLFAHGGSGFVLSHAAMHAVADYHESSVEEWEKTTEIEWAGDCVLGMALEKIGIPLTWSWPHVTTQSIWEQDAIGEGSGLRQWCYPPVTFHHMTPVDIEKLWEFDRGFFADKTNSFLTYGDVFRMFIRPKLTDHISDWDNGSEDVARKGQIDSPFNIFECAENCASQPTCRQYSLTPEGQCKTSGFVMRGKSAPGIKSGTMMWRVDAAIDYNGRCTEPLWIT